MAKLFLVFVLFCLSGLGSQCSAAYWDDLRITWGPVFGEENGFFTRLPRLVTDAVAQGWTNISSTCDNTGNGGEFYGFRYKLPQDDAINLLFDKNGVIAGIQALLPHEDILNPLNPFRYDLVPMFRNETVNGRLHVVLTAYFVPPETVCTTGRTLFDIIEQGTGTGLYFQNGDSPNSQIDVPLTRPEAAEIGWTNCECFPGMGRHNFWEVEKWADTKCNQIQPTQATYNLDDEMIGFIFQISGPSTSPRFETPPNEALVAIIGPTRIPECILASNTNFGSATIHIYMVDAPWTIGCTV